ncbi:protein kinase [Nannocystis pusilla]|uniref:Protein kinase n=1 Tax=Nannocystis pusilla TaxID=889268 RepID=A0A9X3IUG6_9BACT|nr:serine/threonine protein kinase [Nannocystis pusilla]MCY1004376.1 protein kinase [Nannocystis pusilla]
MSREAALHDLLVSLFSAGELRMHLFRQHEGGELLTTLPEGASQATLVMAVIEALKRRGLIDHDFFDGLEAGRPKRVNEVRQVRAQWIHGVALDRGAKWADARYELEASCGRGNFGLVWKALDRHTLEYVALKILLEQHSDDPRIRQRFARGARVLAALSHPAIVKVRSGIEQEGLRFFYAMDYLEGRCLGSLVGERPRDELIAHIIEIGDALDHLHARGLLHRDVKPGNILVTSKGQPKLIDFDLVSGDNFAAMTTRALGTAIYAPPEAITTDPKTAAYDVFSLARTVECVLRGREPRLDELGSCDALETSTAVKDVLRAALLHDPSRRTNSVAQFCRDLERAWAGERRLVRRAEVEPREATETLSQAGDARLHANASQTNEAHLQTEARLQEEARAQEEARLKAEARAQEEARLQEEARAQEEARLQAEARAQEQARLQEEARAQEEARLQAEARAQEQARQQADLQAHDEARQESIRRVRAVQAQTRESERRQLQVAGHRARESARRRVLLVGSPPGDVSADASDPGADPEATSPASHTRATAVVPELPAASESWQPRPPWQMGEQAERASGPLSEPHAPSALARLPWTTIGDVTYVCLVLGGGICYGKIETTPEGLFLLAGVLLGGLAALSLIYKVLRHVLAVRRTSS